MVLDLKGFKQGEKQIDLAREKITTFPVIMVYMLSTSMIVDSKCVVAS
jgi:hypothetical protein